MIKLANTFGAWAAVAAALPGLWPQALAAEERGPTFNREVASILYQACGQCHREGQAAPFSLLHYAEAKKRARQIAEVVGKRSMPPWMPAPGCGDFVGERRLSDGQIELLRSWAAQGAPEGEPGIVPPLPKWSDEWQLGPPDLIVKMPQPLEVPAEGKDIYRNVAFPIPVGASKFVRGVEFHPGNGRVLHHSFIYVDQTRQSRRLSDRPGGLVGMELPETAIMPPGQLLSWQPGKTPSFSPPGLSWFLRTNSDFVVQLHLHPTGKVESIQPVIGLYFTDQAPSIPCFRLVLRRLDFEIPAGLSNVVVEQSYRLPVAAEVTRILPHAHYLGKDLQCYAVLPDGTRQWLIWIKDWDFNWQGDYQYKQPVALPAGTTLWMRYTYDNSAGNPQNPHQPPQTVFHGEQTTDEMASVSLQLTTRSQAERQTLARDFSQFYTEVSKNFYLFSLKRNPADSAARTRLARILSSQGSYPEALDQLREALRADPKNDKAYYELGYLYLLNGRLPEAYDAFQSVVRLSPEDFQAFGSLGLICLKTGRAEEAKAHLQKAIRLNPDDEISRRNLALIENGERKGAVVPK